MSFNTGEGDKRYTLMLVDADGPDPTTQRLRERCHWLVYGKRLWSGKKKGGGGERGGQQWRLWQRAG